MPLKRYVALFARYLKPHASSVGLLSALLLAGIALQLAFPQILSRFVDSAREGAPLDALAAIGGVYLLVTLANQIVATAEAYLATNIGQLATNAMRADLTAHCLRLDSTFHNTRTPGELIERVDGDVGALGGFFSRLVVDVAGNVLLLLAILAVLAAVDGRLALAFGAVSVGAIASLRALSGAPMRFRRAARQASAEFYGFLEERLAGTEDVRASGAVPYTMRRFYERLRHFFVAEMKASVVGWSMGNVTTIALTLCMVIAITLGAALHAAGEISLGAIFMLVGYTQQLRRPIEQLNRQAQELANATASITRIEELFAERSALTGGSLMLPAGPLAVQLESATLVYPGDTAPALDSLTLDLAPGRVLGLLGRTGSGKTTLGRLLCRLYDPTTGAVRLGGVDLRHAQLADVRRRVGVVTQEVQLFHATVRDNLTFFDPTMPDARLLETIEWMELWPWFASLPEGLDTRLAPNGGGLSAGEAQLLAFVRVFLKDPGLVILDEASARLDPATERRIERGIDRLLRDRTAVIIAHRLTTLDRADEILLLDQGRALEHGPRAALAANPHSRFHELLRAGATEVLV
ncbi:MAG TPA: ABC transporter ATP-binding protein [Chloroflexota bacterium]|nr:ABC transporter ATP-binding protein [Chloroflexota bacterium]